MPMKSLRSAVLWQMALATSVEIPCQWGGSVYRAMPAWLPLTWLSRTRLWETSGPSSGSSWMWPTRSTWLLAGLPLAEAVALEPKIAERDVRVATDQVGVGDQRVAHAVGQDQDRAVHPFPAQLDVGRQADFLVNVVDAGRQHHRAAAGWQALNRLLDAPEIARVCRGPIRR